jgi:hypothetical protein
MRCPISVFTPREHSSLGIRSAMGAPMYHSGNVIGFIYTDTHSIEQPFREEHLQY